MVQREALFFKNIVINETEENSRKQFVNFFITTSQCLNWGVPVDVKIIRDSQYLHPLKRNDTGATAGIYCLSLKMIQVLSNY